MSIELVHWVPYSVFDFIIRENGNPGEFVKNYGAILQRLFTGKKDVQISFALFGINDISCIDLVDFSKVEDADASSCFRSAGSVKEVLAALPNEVTLPTFLLLNVQCRTPQGTTTNGTLILVQYPFLINFYRETLEGLA